MGNVGHDGFFHHETRSMRYDEARRPDSGVPPPEFGSLTIHRMASDPKSVQRHTE
jgi:hypothetical protein